MKTIIIMILIFNSVVIAESEIGCDCPQGTVQVGAPYPDSTVFYCEKINPPEKHQLHGPWRLWHEDGQLIELGEYIDGLKSNTWTIWYLNGQMQSTGKYVNGQREELWKEWYQDGTQSWQGEWKDGKLHGKVIVWYKNGQKASESYWENGVRIGN